MGVGKNLKKILAEKNMKITELSVASGVKINTLYSITKRDTVNVDTEILKAIANALNVSIFDLMYDVDQIKEEARLYDDIEPVFGGRSAELLHNYSLLNDEG